MLTFSHLLYWKNNWGPHGDCVIMGLCQIGPRYFGFFSILFTNFGGLSYTCYWDFLQIFLFQFWVRLKHECVLYQACTVFVEVTYFLANEKKTYFSWPCVGCRGTTED